ncbi:MAG TPA: hypothetical protein VFG86_22145 [Chloroflexota bacterium]|jgi:hypothetical protein|nr:hypothetical protein [Chloroflexota bacterium]
MAAALDEVERRFRGGLRGIASAEARITSTRARDDLARKARQNARLVGAAGAVVFGVIGYAAYSAIKARQEANKPQNRLRQRFLGARNELEGRVRPRVEESRRQLERARQRSLLLKLEPESGGYVRLIDARLERPADKNKERVEVIKKLVWALVLSVFMALGSVFARRAAGAVWKASVSEEPPTQRNQ